MTFRDMILVVVSIMHAFDVKKKFYQKFFYIGGKKRNDMGENF